MAYYMNKNEKNKKEEKEKGKTLVPKLNNYQIMGAIVAIVIFLVASIIKQFT